MSDINHAASCVALFQEHTELRIFVLSNTFELHTKHFDSLSIIHLNC